MGDEGIPFRDIAGIIGRRLNLPVVSIPREKAMKHFEWLGGFVPMVDPVSCSLTRERLGWSPTRQGLLHDLEHGTHFEGRRSKYST